MRALFLLIPTASGVMPLTAASTARPPIRLDWISCRTPDGDTWVEYMVQHEGPPIARDGRWLLQLYDKNGTRTEIMVRKPVQKPCCSENMDPYIK